MNLKTPIDSLNYVRFFFNEAAGRHGHFYIVENLHEIKIALKLADDINWEIGQNKTADLEKYLPISTVDSFKHNTETGEITFDELFMIFKDSLFKAKVVIKTNEENLGELQLIEEELLIEGIGGE